MHRRCNDMRCRGASGARDRPMMRAASICVVLGILGCSTLQPATAAFSASLSALTCDSLTSCSPEQCTVNTESDCSLSIATPDFATAMTDLACKTCSPSTTGYCTQLANTLKTDRGVKAAWCNADFLVIVSDGLPKWSAPTFLQGVPLPPGGDDTCRVRTASSQLLVWKVPLSPSLLEAGGSNTVPSPLPNIPGMPEAGAAAVGLDGVPIFPNYNNRGMFTYVSCEVDKCNAHSGKGDDYHYHGDPYGTNCLYSDADYGSATHPPLIAFSLDGYEVFGRYTSSSHDGVDVELDSCGGHTHGNYAYHYHPETRTATTTELDGTQLNGATVSYTAYLGSPMECWAGDVGQINNFFTTNGAQVNYDSSKDALCTRNDFTDLQPCCGMTSYYSTSGATPVTAAGSTSTCSTTGSGCSTTGSTILGTCSGTDDQGNSCPPDYDAERPCPPGCTSTASTRRALQDDCTTSAPTTGSTPAPTTSGTGTCTSGTGGCVGSTTESTAAPTSGSSASGTGTCTGTDDQGNSCPPDYDSERPCPPGCTSVPARRHLLQDCTALSWETCNTASYMCPASTSFTDRELACAQTQYPAGANEGLTATLTCSSGVVECLVFATSGLAGGSCAGDEFKEDPSGSWGYLPDSVASSCIGQTSCDFTHGERTINGVVLTYESYPSTDKFKIVALCSDGSTSAPVTPSPTPAPVTPSPTPAPVTPSPTPAPVTAAPTPAPAAGSTPAPVTAAPTPAPVAGSTPAPVTAAPTPAPVAGSTPAPVTASPTPAPVAGSTPAPAAGSTPAPVTASPTPAPVAGSTSAAGETPIILAAQAIVAGLPDNFAESAAEQDKFRDGVAASFSETGATVARSDVTITRIETSANAGRRRGLLQTTYDVDYTVSVAATSSASEADLRAAAADPVALTAALASSIGQSVSVTSAPVVSLVEVATPAPTSEPMSTGSSASSAAWALGLGAAALLALAA